MAHTDFTVSLSSAGFGGGPGFGGVGTGGSSFAFSSTSKPTGGSLSAGTVCVGARSYSSVIVENVPSTTGQTSCSHVEIL